MHCHNTYVHTLCCIRGRVCVHRGCQEEGSDRHVCVGAATPTQSASYAIGTCRDMT